MTKKQLVQKEIEMHEKEIERLKLVQMMLAMNEDNGSTIRVCPDCGTKNDHWNTKGGWCCAGC